MKPNDAIKQAIAAGTILRVQPVAPEKRPVEEVWHGLVVALACLPVNALMLMLGLGAAHSLWPDVPAAGYWTSMLLFLGIRTVSLTVRPARSTGWPG